MEGPITSLICCALAAAKRRSSVSEDMVAVSRGTLWRSISLFFLPMGVPPGSSVVIKGIRRPPRYPPASFTWVDFPQPSMPSKVINLSIVTLSTGEFSMQRYVFYVNPRRKVTGNTAGYTWVAGFLLSEITSGSLSMEGHQ
jgi:hypothetical protein